MAMIFFTSVILEAEGIDDGAAVCEHFRELARERRSDFIGSLGTYLSGDVKLEGFVTHWSDSPGTDLYIPPQQHVVIKLASDC